MTNCLLWLPGLEETFVNGIIPTVAFGAQTSLDQWKDAQKLSEFLQGDEHDHLTQGSANTYSFTNYSVSKNPTTDRADINLTSIDQTFDGMT